jgi:multimeric flavodoxin WrbA
MSGLLLGVACGQPNGSAEILLKAALIAAEGAGAEVELVRLDELRIPSGPDAIEPDDALWFWEKLLASDALIISTPIITRTVAARLKLLGDRLLGPNADAAIIEELMKITDAGGEPTVPFRVDERVLKPRVAGFIAVGGSLTSQWKTLTLPLMHTMTLSMQTAVVDQVQFEGAGTPRSIVLDDAALVRASELGGNVAEQIGRSFEEAEYRGDRPGLCPMCHLDVAVLRGKDVECATCGARGTLVVDGANVTVDFSPRGLQTSVLSMRGKRERFFEIQETAQRHAAQRDEIEARARSYDGYDRRVTPSPLARHDAAT